MLSLTLLSFFQMVEKEKQNEYMRVRSAEAEYEFDLEWLELQEPHRQPTGFREAIELRRAEKIAEAKRLFQQAVAPYMPAPPQVPAPLQVPAPPRASEVTPVRQNTSPQPVVSLSRAGDASFLAETDRGHQIVYNPVPGWTKKQNGGN